MLAAGLASANVCDPEDSTRTQGGVTVEREQVNPRRYYVKSTFDEDTGIAAVDVKARDECTGADITDPDEVHVRFDYPYNSYSGYYTVGYTIPLKIRWGVNPTATVYGIHDGVKSRKRVSPIDIPVAPSTCGYLMNNLWILLIAYAAVMSYRFFSGRAMDFKDMWDEYMGKK